MSTSTSWHQGRALSAVAAAWTLKLALPIGMALGIAGPACALPIPIGDPLAYQRVRHFSDVLTPRYVPRQQEQGGIDSILAFDDRGQQVGLSSTTGFGLYGAEAYFPGGSRVGREDTSGTRVDLVYQQRYRTDSDATRDTIDASFFNVRLELADFENRQGPFDYSAEFYLQLWVSTGMPPPPNADVVDDPLLIDRLGVSYGRVGAFIRGNTRDGWDFGPFQCIQFECFEHIVFDQVIDRDGPVVSIEARDTEIHFPLALGPDTEFTLTTRLLLFVQGDPGREGYAKASLWDPQRGGGARIGVGEPAVQGVPAPGTWWLAAAGLLLLLTRSGARGCWTAWTGTRGKLRGRGVRRPA